MRQYEDYELKLKKKYFDIKYLIKYLIETVTYDLIIPIGGWNSKIA